MSNSARAAFDRPHDFIAAGHGQLAYWRFGQGPDVVLVHGWPLTAATFRHLVPILARHFTLHLFDLPGVGHSEWSGPIGLASHAAAVRAAIDTLGLGRYGLLAHDSGGTIARLVAADDPRAAALVLGNTEIPRHHPWMIKLYAWAAAHPRVAKLLFAGMRLGFVRRSFLGFGGVFSDPRYVDGEFGALFVRPLLTSPAWARGHMAFANNLDFALVDALDAVHARITAPVLCIWGSDDPWFPLAKARPMLATFGGTATLVEIPGAKLFAHEDHAAEFGAHAERFLGRALGRAHDSAA